VSGGWIEKSVGSGHSFAEDDQTRTTKPTDQRCILSSVTLDPASRATTGGQVEYIDDVLDTNRNAVERTPPGSLFPLSIELLGI
jgi:hypothetical protein